MQETLQIQKHEDRINAIEAKMHIQDISSALLTKEVTNLSVNVDKLTKVIDRVSDELSDILPQIKISKQWEDIYRAGMFTTVGAIGAGIFALIFNYIKTLHP